MRESPGQASLTSANRMVGTVGGAPDSSRTQKEGSSLGTLCVTEEGFTSTIYPQPGSD